MRPPIRPLTDSRSDAGVRARGSIAYSAVTQPEPLPLRHRGTPSVNDAAHSTRVRPNSTSTDPSAWSSQPRVIVTGRSSSAERPSTRVPVRRVEDMRRTLTSASHTSTTMPGSAATAGPWYAVAASTSAAAGSYQGGTWVTTRLPDAGPGRELAGLTAGQVQVGRVVRGRR